MALSLHNHVKLIPLTNPSHVSVNITAKVKIGVGTEPGAHT
jgi:hypothetical protein